MGGMCDCVRHSVGRRFFVYSLHASTQEIMGLNSLQEEEGKQME